jgi:hypothetical protein
MGMATRRARDAEIRGVIGVCIAGVTAILLNSFFDPTLEGAQVAAVLFTLFGLGIVAARASQAAGRDRGDTAVRAALPAAPAPSALAH